MGLKFRTLNKYFLYECQKLKVAGVQGSASCCRISIGTIHHPVMGTTRDYCKQIKANELHLLGHYCRGD